MSSTQYGHKLNPYRRLRQPLGVKGIRQSVVITNNPSTIDQNQQLLVQFPNLGVNDVIVPGTTRLAFTITIQSDDLNRTLVQNIGRAIIKKTTIKISGNEIVSIDDSDIYYGYQDLWQTSTEREYSAYQGIDMSTDGNITRLRIASGNADNTNVGDLAIARAYGNRYYIPLDFEMLESHMPFYQSGLSDRLEYELTFNDYSKVIRSTDLNASYTIDNISLEYEMVTMPNLAQRIGNQYSNRLAILYDRILRHRKIKVNKSDTLWNININVPTRSMKGILMLFKRPIVTDTEEYYNPKITKVEVTIEGVPNQLFSQGMRSYQQWDEAKKYFSGGSKRSDIVSEVIKSLQLSRLTLKGYLTTQYSLWLDMRTNDDDNLHGNGRKIENASEGITIQITKEAEVAGPLNLYLYIVMDAQLNIENGRFVSAQY